MSNDTNRLIAHIGAHAEVSESYSTACQRVPGSAYGVELRTLAAAHRGVAGRLEQRLRELGGGHGALPRNGLVDVGALANDAETGIKEVLRGENRLIDDLAATCRADDVTEETRRLIHATLFHVRAHAHRVELFCASL